MAQEELDDATTNILKKVESLFDEKLGSLKRAIVEEQQSLARRVDKRLKTSERTFKNKSNRIQFGLNTDVLDKIGEAKCQLSGESSNVEKAVEHLEEGMVLLEKRNRGIEIADYSEFGWATVDEYEQREVAEDSDDDRRLRKAEASVARKFQSKRRGSFRGRYNYSRNYQPYQPYQKNYQNYQNFQNDFSFTPSQRSNQPFRGGRGSFTFPRANSFGYDKCFACGSREHWRSECPFANAAMASRNGGQPSSTV